MYLDFYNLHMKPFQISTDPKFLWLGEKHKEALAVLKYGILDNKGFLLLTGDVGTGKTTLLNALIDSLGEDVLVALVTDPGLAKMDFFNFVADSFVMDKNFKSKGEFLIYLKNFLLEVHRQNKQTLLIIDECQHLNQKLLEEVRLLSNIEKYNTKLINIFFVGQSEFNNIILRPHNRAIRQRITINYNISALSESETDQYIRFRLNVAGSKAPIFTSQAIKAVYKFSNGYPRLINIICDQALLTGYVKEKRKIDEDIVAECADELKISHGAPIIESMATPEAAAEKPADAPSVPVESGFKTENLKRQFRNPRVIAFVIVLIIWFGLVAMFVANQQRTVVVQGAGRSPGDPGASITQDNNGVSQDQSNTLGENHRDGGVVKTDTDLTVEKPISDQPHASAEKPASLKNTSPPEPAVAVSPPPARNQADPAVNPENGQPSILASADAGNTARISLAEIKAKFGDYPEVRFGFNSNKLDRESYDILGLIARYCLQNPGAAIVLRGYTDRSGVRAYNLKLSEFRADMVKTYLVGRGVNESRIDSIAMGPEAVGPDGEDPAEGGSRRKVVIEIIPPPE